MKPAGQQQCRPHHRQQLRAAYYATAAHNLLIYQELTHLLQAIHNSQLTIHNPAPSPVEGSQLTPLVILLKGIALALAPTLYPDPALRPVSDIDLLLRHQHLEAAVQAMQSLGYREAPPFPDMAPWLDWEAYRSHHVRMRGGPQGTLDVDLHWRLVAGDTDWRTPPMDWFWEQTEEYQGIREKGEKGIREKGGKEKREDEAQSNLSRFSFSTFQLFSSSVLQLTPTAHLLYLAAHLVLQHGGAQARLIWYYDLHLLITREGERLDPSTGSGLRWDELLARARKFRWSAALHAALQGTQERFGTPLPAGFLEALAETRDAEATRLVQRMAGPVQTRAVRVWDHVASQSWRGRLRLAWAIACPSPEYMRWRYRSRPAWLWPLWYPYRWFDIARDGLATLWRIGKGKVGTRE